MSRPFHQIPILLCVLLSAALLAPSLSAKFIITLKDGSSIYAEDYFSEKGRLVCEQGGGFVEIDESEVASVEEAGARTGGNPPPGGSNASVEGFRHAGGNTADGVSVVDVKTRHVIQSNNPDYLKYNVIIRSERRARAELTISLKDGYGSEIAHVSRYVNLEPGANDVSGQVLDNKPQSLESASAFVSLRVIKAY